MIRLGMPGASVVSSSAMSMTAMSRGISRLDARFDRPKTARRTQVRIRDRHRTSRRRFGRAALYLARILGGTRRQVCNFLIVAPARASLIGRHVAYQQGSIARPPPGGSVTM